MQTRKYSVDCESKFCAVLELRRELLEHLVAQNAQFLNRIQESIEAKSILIQKNLVEEKSKKSELQEKEKLRLSLMQKKMQGLARAPKKPFSGEVVERIMDVLRGNNKIQPKRAPVRKKEVEKVEEELNEFREKLKRDIKLALSHETELYKSKIGSLSDLNGDEFLQHRLSNQSFGDLISVVGLQGTHQLKALQNSHRRSKTQESHPPDRTQRTLQSHPRKREAATSHLRCESSFENSKYQMAIEESLGESTPAHQAAQLPADPSAQGPFSWRESSNPRSRLLRTVVKMGCSSSQGLKVRGSPSGARSARLNPDSRKSNSPFSSQENRYLLLDDSRPQIRAKLFNFDQLD